MAVINRKSLIERLNEDEEEQEDFLFDYVPPKMDDAEEVSESVSQANDLGASIPAPTPVKEYEPLIDNLPQSHSAEQLGFKDTQDRLDFYKEKMVMIEGIADEAGGMSSGLYDAYRYAISKYNEIIDAENEKVKDISRAPKQTRLLPKPMSKVGWQERMGNIGEVPDYDANLDYAWKEQPELLKTIGKHVTSVMTAAQKFLPQAVGQWSENMAAIALEAGEKMVQSAEKAKTPLQPLLDAGFVANSELLKKVFEERKTPFDDLIGGAGRVTTQWSKDIMEQAREYASKYATGEDAPQLEKILTAMGSGGVSILGAVGTAIITKNPMMAAFIFGLAARGDTYGSAREAGVDIDTASNAAAVRQVWETGLEFLGLEFLLTKFPNMSKGMSMFLKGLSEGGQEGGQEIGGNVIEKFVWNKEKNIGDNVFMSVAIGAFFGASVDVIFGELVDTHSSPETQAELKRRVEKYYSQVYDTVSGLDIESIYDGTQDYEMKDDNTTWSDGEFEDYLHRDVSDILNEIDYGQDLDYDVPLNDLAEFEPPPLRRVTKKDTKPKIEKTKPIAPRENTIKMPTEQGKVDVLLNPSIEQMDKITSKKIPMNEIIDDLGNKWVWGGSEETKAEIQDKIDTYNLVNNMTKTEKLNAGLTPEDIKVSLTAILRGTKKNTVADIKIKQPDIKVSKDIPNVRTVYGEKVTVPKDTVFSSYEMKDGKVLLQSKDNAYLLPKNIAQNIIGNSIKAEPKPFAPELKNTIKTEFTNEPKELKDLLVFETNLKAKYGKNLSKAPLTQEENAEYTRLINVPCSVEFPQYGMEQYNLPGGTDYKEVTTQTPKDIEAKDKLTVFIDKMNKKYEQTSIGVTYDYMTTEEIDTLEELQDNVVEPPQQYNSMHFPKYGDKLWWHRRDMRTTVDGSKVFFLEEIQSDWNKSLAKAKRVYNQFLKEVSPETPGYERTKQDLFEETEKGGAHTSPLLKNWAEGALKVALEDAVNTDAEYFTWTTGEQQKARWSLSQALKAVEWVPGDMTNWVNVILYPKGRFDSYEAIIDKNTRKVIKVDATFNQLQDKDISEIFPTKICDQILSTKEGTIEDEGLNIGGEWAEEIYDKKIPSLIKKLTGEEIVDVKLPVLADSNTIINGNPNKSMTQQGIKITDDVKALVEGKALAKEDTGKLNAGLTPEDIRASLEAASGADISIIQEAIMEQKANEEVAPKRERMAWEPTDVAVRTANISDEYKFREPTLFKFITPKGQLMRQIGAEELLGDLPEAKGLLALREIDINHQIQTIINEINKDVTIKEKFHMWKNNTASENEKRFRDLLNNYQKAPDFLSESDKKIFTDLRNFTSSLLDITNVFRKEAGLDPINKLEDYIPHFLDEVARAAVNGRYPYVADVYRWTGKKVRPGSNPTAKGRTVDKVTDLLNEVFSKDLGKLLKAMAKYDLRDIYLAIPYAQVRANLKSLEGKIPKTVIDEINAYLDYDINNRPTALDELINRTLLPLTDKLNPALIKHFNRVITDPIRSLSSAYRQGLMLGAIAGKPQLITRNLFQKMLTMDLYPSADFVKAQFYAPKWMMNEIRNTTFYKLSVKKFEDLPPGGKLVAAGLKAYGLTHAGLSYISNVDVAMRTGYLYGQRMVDFCATPRGQKYIQDFAAKHNIKEGTKEYDNLTWKEGDQIKEAIEAGSLTQWLYFQTDMPLLFRGQSGRALFALQSWSMNFYGKHMKEMMNRTVRGTTGRGRAVRKADRSNSLKGIMIIAAITAGLEKATGISMGKYLLCPFPTMFISPALKMVVDSGNLTIGLLTDFVKCVTEDRPMETLLDNMQENAHKLKQDVELLYPKNAYLKWVSWLKGEISTKEFLFYTNTHKEWKQIWIDVGQKNNTLSISTDSEDWMTDGGEGWLGEDSEDWLKEEDYF